MTNKHIGSSLDSLLHPDDDTQDVIGKLRSLEPPQFGAPLDPQHTHTPDDDRIFVFGSNVHGWHGGGAAWYAHAKLGAEWNVGEGLTGRTYALPTCFEPGLPVDFMTLAQAVDNFIDFAEAHPELRFFVSEVGCGLAGFQADEVKPYFADAPANCDLPPGWRMPRPDDCDDCGRAEGKGHDAKCFYHGPY